MNVEDRIRAIRSYVSSTYRKLAPAFRDYPRDILDLIIFHKLHFYMPEKEALQAFRRLKTSFVDWNEVRISSVKEIQDVFESVPDSLELAIFIKDFLEHLHRENQSLSLEFLAERNLGEIRRYLKGIKGIESTTINLILRLRREYPVLPVSGPMERTLVRLGVVRAADRREQKERYLHNLVTPEDALTFHHFLLQHSREICPPDDEKIQCMSCGIRRSCSYFERSQRSKAASDRNGTRRRKRQGTSARR